MNGGCPVARGSSSIHKLSPFASVATRVYSRFRALLGVGKKREGEETAASLQPSSGQTSLSQLESVVESAVERREEAVEEGDREWWELVFGLWEARLLGEAPRGAAAVAIHVGHIRRATAALAQPRSQYPQWNQVPLPAFLPLVFLGESRFWIENWSRTESRRRRENLCF